LFVDASYYKVRDEVAGRYKTKALLTVAGIREDGHRKILGLKLAESEGEDFWLELFEELKNRGLASVKLVVSDGHKRKEIS
ncbi:MAG: transposase, partial [Thermotogae bacterium]|nr:transposase [Thermotogota bacterium]